MKNLIVIKPKTQEYTCFVYGSSADLENLIKFVGKSPAIGFENGKMTLSYKKQVIKEGTVIFRDSLGNVTNVIPVEKVNEYYEIIKESDFTPADGANIPAQAAKEKKEKKAKK